MRIRPFLQSGCRSAALPRVLLLLAVTLSSCSQLRGPADEPFSRQDWLTEGFVGRRITTAHFDVYSTVRDTEFEAALPRFLEAAYAQYESTVACSREGDTKLTMYVFGTRFEWEQFTRRRYPARNAAYLQIKSGGYTEGDVSISFYLSRAQTLATLAHEGWHQYAAACFNSPLPAWLNEGLACWHEAVEWTGSKPRFTPRRNTFRINSLREAVQRDSLFRLAELIATDAGEVMLANPGRSTQTYYAQAWVLMTFLRDGAGRKHAAAFDRLLADLAGGEFGARISAFRLTTPEAAGLSFPEAVFRAYFTGNPEQLEKDYYNHVVLEAGF